MRKGIKKGAVLLLAALMAFETVPMTANAAEEAVVAVESDRAAEREAARRAAKENEKRDAYVTVEELMPVLNEAMMVEAEATDANVEIPEIITADGITTGTMGANGGINYSYNSATKTLTISGTETDFHGGFVNEDDDEPISAFAYLCPEVEKIVVENCTLNGNAYYLFANLEYLTSVEFKNVNTANVTDMGGMFYGCISLESLDLSGFNTANVTLMDKMFRSCECLTALNVSSFNTANVTDMREMFAGCVELTSLNVSSFNTANVTAMSDMFASCWALESLDVSNFNTSKVTEMSFMFYDCETLTSLDLSNFDTSNVEWFSYMFTSCDSLADLDISSFNTSTVLSFSGMFEECYAIKELDLSHFDVTGAFWLSEMFQNCTALEKVNLSSFDTKNIIEMDCMFYGCSSLKELDITNFDTSNVTFMDGMFTGCTLLKEIDLSSFNTAKVQDMSRMFVNCTALERLDLSNFDLSSLVGADSVLENCTSLNVILTPKALASGITITLPATYYIDAKTTTGEVSNAHSNMMLVKTLPTETRDLILEASKDINEITIGNSLQMSLIIDGETLPVARNKEFIWTVDNPNVISVSDSGLVTGVGMGTATVTCTYKFNAEETTGYQFVISIPFSDIAVTDWQYPYVVYVYENNIMAGKDGNFDMNGEITRSEFVTVLYNYNKKPAVTYSQDFSDVTQADWFAKPITWAKQNNITAGYADGRFGVYDSITREQLVVMLYKYAKATGVVTEDVTVDLSDFADAADVTSWAQKALTWATQNNIITGKNANGVKNIAPQDSTTRGECATMIKKYIALIEE